MGSTFWTERSKPRLDPESPYLVLHFVLVFVRDQQKSLQFYRDQLGFTVIVDHLFPTGDRWIEVAPPDGTARLALVSPEPDSEDYKQIGEFRYIFFLTENVEATYEEWRKRGVRFQSALERPEWGGTTARFEDVDGNSFGLVGVDSATQEMEAQRLMLAEKAEVERRAAQEIEIAKQVQARLFPQTLPACATLDYAGMCIQARQVGGDYYDFLDLGEERLGLILGDISGKGIAAALLMANLQANVRSQYAMALHQPQRFLQSTNRLFYENTADSAYATLFFADYDPTLHQLTYVNCGHLPGFLFRINGTLEKLESTATVLGLFKKWDCSLQSVRFSTGDILVMYTDGVTEAMNAAQEEFGEDRLIAAIENCHKLPAHGMLGFIVDEVKRFSTGEQSDDITVIVAKCGPN